VGIDADACGGFPLIQKYSHDASSNRTGTKPAVMPDRPVARYEKSLSWISGEEASVRRHRPQRVRSVAL
jgi:hypothetical protein